MGVRRELDLLGKIADDAPGGLPSVLEALHPASIGKHIFPKVSLQLLLPLFSLFHCNVAPHRRYENNIWHRFLAK